jgi:hypothetical protein
VHQEYTALIKYIQMGKENDTDWFQIESNKEGTVWSVAVFRVFVCICVCVPVRLCACVYARLRRLLHLCICACPSGAFSCPASRPHTRSDGWLLYAGPARCGTFMR